MTQTATGWRKNLGATMTTIGGITGLGSIKEGNLDQGIGSLIFIGIGSALIATDKKGSGLYGSGDFNSNKLITKKGSDIIKKLLKNNPHHISKIGKGIGGVSDLHVKKLLEKYKNKKMTIKQMLGDDWRKHGADLLHSIKQTKLENEKIEQNNIQTGGNIFKDISKGAKNIYKGTKKAVNKGYKEAKKIRDKAYHKMKDFIDGKTSFKPSDLIRYTGYAVQLIGVASTVLDAGIISLPMSSAINAGLQVGSKVLAETGRGYIGSGVPKHLKKWMKDHPNETKIVFNTIKRHRLKTGRGLAVLETFKSLGTLARGAYNLYNWIINSGLTLDMVKQSAYASHKAMAGYGLQPSGGKLTLPKLMPKHLKDFINNETYKAHNVIKHISNKKGGAISLSTISALGSMAYTLYKFLKDNPELISRVSNYIKQLVGNIDYSELAKSDFLSVGQGLPDNLYPGEYVSTGVKRILNDLARNSDSDLSKSKLGLAIGLSGVALASAFALYKKLRKKKGKGSSIPPKLQSFLKKYPIISKKIGIIAKTGEGSQAGSGKKLNSLLAATGLIGTTSLATAYALYNYALQNPVFTAKLAAKGAKLALLGSGYTPSVHGAGLQTSGTGLYPVGKRGGKKKKYGTREEVMNGSCQCTRGGLYKENLFICPKSRKIKSKKKSELGKKNMYFLKKN